MRKQKILNKLTKQEKNELLAKLREEPLEKGDLKAMIIAAFLNLFPVVILTVIAFVVVIWFFFLR